MTKPQTYVYVDGFNLYYRAVKDTPYKWLNIADLCSRLLKKNDITCIKYFTANVDGKGDADRPNRQQVYLRALRTLPNFEIISGQFTSHAKWLPFADPKDHGGKKGGFVIRTEEKGSDVNLATHMVHDAHAGKYQACVLISNDSDLAEPLRIVRDEIGIPVGVVYPAVKGYPSQKLTNYATFVRQVREGLLKSCQFPEEMTDEIGKFRKPSVW
jgi:hypothetical protein